jgi:hypothetical protein
MHPAEPHNLSASEGAEPLGPRDGWLLPPKRRLPIYGERAVDIAIRDLLNDASFGLWLHDTAGLREACRAIDVDWNINVWSSLIMLLDAASDPGEMSANAALAVLWVPEPADIPDEPFEEWEDEAAYCYGPTFLGHLAEEIAKERAILNAAVTGFLIEGLRVRGFCHARPATLVHICGSRLSPIDPPSTGGVYFVRANDRVKIGTARNVASRIRELQTAAPYALELLLVKAGEHSVEREFHCRFAALRVIGEWFELAGELETFLAEERFAPCTTPRI